MTVLEGTSLSLHCSTQGSPAPTLTWLKDGELVGTITADELSVLEIAEITPQGDGQYRCLAENEHGRASISLNITVECEYFTVLHLIQHSDPFRRCCNEFQKYPSSIEYIRTVLVVLRNTYL